MSRKIKEGPNKILIVGDTHALYCNIKLIKRVCRKFSISTVIVAGDFGWWPHSDDKDTQMFLEEITQIKWIRFYWVDGNHENFDDLYKYPIDKETRLRKVGNNCYHIPRGEIVNIRGLQVFGFGGAHSIDKHRRTEGVSWWPQEIPEYSEVMYATENIEKSKNIDLVITHDVPQEIFNNLIEFEQHGKEGTVQKQLSHLMNLILYRGFRVNWFCGHYHRHFSHRFHDVNSNGQVIIKVLPDHPLEGVIFDIKKKEFKLVNKELYE